MHLVILDLEMNQPSGRIIQIGAVSLDMIRLEIVPFFNEFVNPQEPLDPYITKLTGITPDTLKRADHLREVGTAFWEKIKEHSPASGIGAWGSDCQKFHKTSVNVGIDVPDVLRMLNVRKVFSGIKVGHEDSIGTGLTKMLAAYGLPFEGQHHDAFDDAYMTTKLLISHIREMRQIGMPGASLT